ncbi:MAG: hypothetical protein ACE5HW_07160 [Candidatus Methanofastidiosia archaeon]
MIDRANRWNVQPGKTKLTKLSFLIEEGLTYIGCKALNFKFFKKHYGPMSKDMLTDIEQFGKNGLIIGKFAQVSRRGKELLKQFDDVFERNKEILKFIDDYTDNFSILSLDKIKNKAYNTEVYDEGFGTFMKVKDIPEDTDLIWRLDEDKADFVFDIKDEELDTLAIYFDEESYTSLKEALEEAKSQRSHVYGGMD